MAIRQISFKVPPGLWSSFRQQAAGVFLTRAGFLDHIISTAVPELREDLGEQRLSLRAKRHISGQLKRQGAKSINIEVREATAIALNDAVNEHNLVRDAFLCRLIIFLRSTNDLLDYLGVSRVVDGRELSGLEQMPVSPLKAIESVMGDPLFYIRHSVRENHECGIYTVPLPRNLDWAACFLDDKDVGGTKAHREDQKLLALAFEVFEADSFAKAAAKKRSKK